MKTLENKISKGIAHTICILFSICALLPFVLLIISSFTNSNWANNNGYSFFPGEWSLEAYRYIAEQWLTIGHAYLMTIVVTSIGTILCLLISTMFAYGISKSEIPGMKMISFLLIFTMLFNGGLVATYYSYVNLWHIKDTIWALILPGLLMNAFCVILIKNYFVNSVPAGLEEAARIDGANEFTVFSRIVLPLSKPILATIGLMSALAYWNDWMNGMYYLSGRGGSRFYTIQIVLNNINNDIMALMQSKNSSTTMISAIVDIPTTTIRMAIAVIGILPILFLYPFFQRYFVKGITLGGVKE